MNRYRLIYTLLLTALMASMNASAGVTVKGSVYGGGNLADVKTNTTVNMGGGQVEGNVYGGGNLGSVGTYDTSSDMKTFDFTANTGTCNVTISGGTIGTGVEMSADGTFANGNVYGAGKGEADTYWCEKAMAYKTNVIINAGTVNGTVYGGGQIGRVENDATVIIGVESPANNTVAPNIIGNVFGAGAGLKTHGYSALLRGDTKVTIQGNAHIGLNVYGGGEKASVGRFVIKGGLPSEPADDGSGDCIVNVRGTAIIGTNTDNNITDKGNVYGTCQGVTPPTSSEFTAYNTNYTSMQAVAQKAPEGTQGTAWAYVDGSDNKYYWVYYETLDAYKEFLNTLALASHPVVTIGGMLANETTGAVTPSGNPTVNGSVFGGGQRGITLGTVAVNIAGGTIYDDVYGGGALADTNKGNQTAEKYDEATVTEDVTIVTGMYTRSGDAEPYTYTEVTTANTLAASGTTYYTKAAQSSINTTTVNLTGGNIKGDAYGGGLGQTGNNPIEAKVWGDISVNLGSSSGSTATAFNITNYSGNYSHVIKSGRVFGCNNLNGSPQGNVTVTVWKTVAGNVTRTAADSNGKPRTDVTPTYELAAVYGGGNLANFTTTGKMASVIIETCDVSVQSVYGGGNAADVPETDVLVKGAYEIGEVFGGGNGEDSYTTDGGAHWTPNPGANVNGNATTLLKGGYIHEAYGGSNTKGTISGNVSINKSSGGVCTLQVDDLYGAGKNADIEGDLIVILGCSETRTGAVYGCAKNANVKGNVELTITSGEYGKVFGGNNQSGSIFGHIIVNIEEIGCTPIKIDELYLGGNNAAYSVYGYYQAKKYVITVSGESGDEDKLFMDVDGTIPLYENGGIFYKDEGNTIPLYKDNSDNLYINEEMTRPLYLPRTSANDHNTAVTFVEHPHTVLDEDKTQYDNPELNIISCTSIGQVFGGGLGTSATLYGNPKVNINMIEGKFANFAPASGNPNKLGAIGTVYGGGNAADVIGDPTVNIGTLSSVNKIVWNSTDDKPVYLDDGKTPSTTSATVLGAYISGNVFGGGKGSEDTFQCEKAMIGKNGAGAIDADGDGELDTEGGTTVNIYKGTVRGNVYGGGEVGRVEKNTMVRIGNGAGTGNGTPAPIIMGSVFGGGKGKETHGYSALVRGNPTVIVEGDAKVRHSVYGGGEIASVARYKVATDPAEAAAHGVEVDMPYVLADPNNPSGNCTVIVGGYAEIGPEDGMLMTREGGPDDTGYVFGAGKGVMPKEYDYQTESQYSGSNYKIDEHMPKRMLAYDSKTIGTIKKWVAADEDFDYDNPENGKNIWEYFTSEKDYLTFIETLALGTKTFVTIRDHAFVKGSVYGGSENGIVKFDTQVNIEDDCQIGSGYAQMDDEGEYLNAPVAVNRRYTDDEWAAGHLITTNDPVALQTLAATYYTSSLPECASWEFNSTNPKPYDMYDLDDNGNPKPAYDGHTFYGNVFGGGSGYFPYRRKSATLDGAAWVKNDAKSTSLGRPVDANGYSDGVWHDLAGYVGGNTVVNITGGHILTSVYGGNEQTDVEGSCTINMSGGTIGVPRTVGQAQNHPVTCYVFGAGKGDPRINFNTWTNVGSSQVNISGNARIYGSTFGGGEDGHVLGNAETNINTGQDVTIGTGENAPIIRYPYIGTTGTSAVDGNIFGGGRGFSEDALTAGVVGGNVTVNIHDGTILGTVFGGGRLASVGTYFADATESNYGKMQGDLNDMTHGVIRVNIYDGTIGATYAEGDNAGKLVSSDFSIGDVFGGCKGSTSNNLDFGLSKHTYITMSGGRVNGSVYGGGEVAMVEGNTTVNISGGYIGDGVTEKGGAKIGNVYGGGKGNLTTVFAGLIKGNTNVTISNTLADAEYAAAHEDVSEGDLISEPTIYHNVYGGGAYGSVGTFTATTGAPTSWTNNTGTANVTITGGTFGFNGNENGMIFGSSRGDVATPTGTPAVDPNDKLAWVHDTHVTIGSTSSNSNDSPWIKGSVYGSGENGHVFNDTEVTIHSGTIGIFNSTDDGYTMTASNGNTYNGADYPYRGNVYGGGCGEDTYTYTYSEKYDSNENGEIDDGDAVHDVEAEAFNPLAGVVLGNSNITIDGGKIAHNVYGAGALGSVGTIETTTSNGVTTSTVSSGGETTISISGGTIGDDGVGDGNVYGAARGDATTNQTDCALVQTTDVNISGTANVKGSVYGGGETGDVLGNTEVNVCAEKQTSGEDVTYVAASGTPTIGGNVFGGGMGVANSFTCSKAMVGVEGDGVTETTEGEGDDAITTYTLLDGGTTVRIYNGTVGTLVQTTNAQNQTVTTLRGGNVYGGGEIARVERNTSVEIGAATESSSPIIRGSVFAAGAGKETHGYSALVRGHSTVTVQGSAQVLKNVFGGGEKASVGRYKVKTPANSGDKDVPATLPLGMPARLLAGGTSTVNIQGSAVIGTAGVANTGHVYGAGQGLEPSYVYTEYDSGTAYATRITNSRRMVNYTSSDVHKDEKRYKEWDYYIDENGNESSLYVWEYFPTEPAYLQFIESLAISAETYVAIGGKRNESTGEITSSGDPTVNGSVFGGSESGFVYRNTDVKIKGGTVEGDAFGGGRGLESFAEAGRVKWNTGLAVSGGAVKGNVYGGGNMGDVGTIYKPAGSHDYVWKNTDSHGNNLDTGNNNSHINNYHETTDPDKKNTGICTVDISGGTIGLASTNKPKEHGNVFGAGRGLANTWWCEKAIVYATDVSVSGGTVYGNVYGGGEVGRVEDDAKVTIGTPSGTDEFEITGSVFGAGAGLATHGYSALVRGNSDVTIQGNAQIGGSVYGGGEIASVGKFTVPNGLPKEPLNGGTCTVKIQGNAKIGSSGTGHNVYGACKGVTPAYNNTVDDPNRSKSMQLLSNAPNDATLWDHYNGDKNSLFIWRYYASETDYLDFLKTLALTSNTHVTIGGSSSIYGSVYGGGERGITLGGVDVNMTGGTVYQDIYGGGSLANSNTAMWDTETNKRVAYVELDKLIPGTSATGYYSSQSPNALITATDATVQSNTTYYAIYKTNVNLTGGTVNHNVYGGGLGQLAKAGVDGVHYTQEEIDAAQEGDAAFGKTTGDWKVEPVESLSAIEAKVYGDVSVKLNETIATDNCEVKGTIFGCNNLNGSPQAGVDVHIYKTYTVSGKPAKNTNNYEVTAVYGGGNLAAYYPDDPTVRETAKAYVTIDGCNLTSIGTVYGGGNAASVPGTEVIVNGTYEIGRVFGGGNGADDYQIDDDWYDNPGANVGYQSYAYFVKKGETGYDAATHGSGTQADPYKVLEYTSSDESSKDASTKEKRIANYGNGYGDGKAHVTIYRGTVHEVYGGSNSRGNVRKEARTTLEDLTTSPDDDDCPFDVGDAYGGGRNAPMDGDAVLEIGCINGLGKAYGGASNADVNGNVELNITNGTYGRVFGGNDQGGLIRGSITVNIEETGCRPIIIGELYGGGNLARYSVYGYNDDGSVKESGDNPVRDPQVNVKSFTSIGTVYGGGYGGPATMVGSPEVNINVFEGEFAETYNGKDNVIEDNARIVGSTVTTNASISGYDSGYPIPSHAKGAIGAINNVFGGGNAAEVIGTPHVNIGTLTGEVITLASKKIEDSEGKAPTDEGWIPSYQLATVKGVDIRGNVYGAGNNAPVTGDTEVVIGKNNDVKTYSFTSYNAASDGTAWSSGLAQTTGATETISDKEYAEVVILTNGKYGEYIGKKFYVDPEGSGRLQLFDEDKHATSLWVDIEPFKLKTYNFKSYGSASGGTPYSSGTAAPTGNFKTLNSSECMQIVVLTNPGETSWEGKTFYVPIADDDTRRRLYEANGTEIDVWVEITE